jgi:hypothetical protein
MTPLFGRWRTGEISWRRSVALVENVIRKELNAMQKAKGVATIYEDIGKAFVKNRDIRFTYPGEDPKWPEPTDYRIRKGLLGISCFRNYKHRKKILKMARDEL